MTPLSHSLKVRHLILAAVLTTGLGFVNYANAQTAQAHRSFLVDLNSRTAVDLGNLIGRGSVGATGINEAGQVVGYIQTAEYPSLSYAFITGPNGKDMRDLGTLGSDFSVGTAYGINNAGQVVGQSFTAEGSPHAFITGPDGKGMRDLGTFLGGGGSVTAHGINDAGQVVGYSVKTEDYFSFHAFITSPDGKGVRELDTLGGYSSEAYGINEAGRVVGYSATADGYNHAFISGPDGEGMTDLNSLVNLPDGVILTQAVGINDNGQVIAIGVIPIPEPEAYALMLAGLVLVGAVIQRKEIV